MIEKSLPSNTEGCFNMPGLLRTGADDIGGGTDGELDDATDELELGARKVAIIGAANQVRFSMIFLILEKRTFFYLCGELLFSSTFQVHPMKD